MSRTDRTRPYRVQMQDPFEQRKYWWPAGKFSTWVPYYRPCNCRTWWCCMTQPNRHERRRDRHVAQRRNRAALKGDFTGWE